MQNLCTRLINVADNQDATTPAIDAGQLTRISFHHILDGAGGDVSLDMITEASNDAPEGCACSFVPQNWIQIPNTFATLTVDRDNPTAQAIVNVPDIAYRWIRVIASFRTPGFGDGTFICNMNAQSN